jgi:acetolactate synthase-1/2/3 large subunit
LNIHDKKEPDYTASDALNDALIQAGVSYVFVNSGTDYPSIIESWAKYEAQGRKKPEIIISPHESVALSAAHGFAQVTGQPQAVFVHVDAGTQNLGGALNNVYRCRVPVFIFAGLSPYTMDGELKGGRDSWVQFIQDAGDQAGIVRGYTKLNCELKCGQNVQQMVFRALQIAKSEPRGAVYMMATREVLNEEGKNIEANMKTWTSVAPTGLDDQSLELLSDALINAKKPLLITTYLGRNVESVTELEKLSDRLALPVAELVQTYVNLPADHPMRIQGHQDMLEEADLILAIDCDVPWVPSMTKPRDDCRVFYLDVDPIKESIPLWHIPAERFMRADSYTALKQLNAKFDGILKALNVNLIATRREEIQKRLAKQERVWAIEEEMASEITPAFLTACVREVIDDDTIVLNEVISDRLMVYSHLPRKKPGTLFACGGGSLGWFGGAAIGAKLACPSRDVVALASDGAYILSNPTSVYWMARRYNTPFLTVIYNNQGWGAPKRITKAQYPNGYAVQQNQFWNSFEPQSNLDLVAEAAGGTLAKTVSKPGDLRAALREGKEAVQKGISAVINVLLPPV